MAWGRKGDNANTHPAVLKIETDPLWDERLVNEAYGFWQRLTEHSAGHMTDGVIDKGAAIQYGGRERWEPLVKSCVRSGLLTVKKRGKEPLWQILDDPDMVHIRTRAELEWERARKLDVANPRLTREVRFRDGDCCRYCDTPVLWAARRGDRRGSYDHRPPGKPAASPEHLVVCCQGCNNRRGNRPLEQADRDVPLLPVPENPFYSPYTVEFLAKHGITVEPSVASSPTGQQPGSSAPTAQHPASAAPTQQPGSSARTAQHPASAGPPAWAIEPSPGAVGGAPPGGEDLQVSDRSSRSEVYRPGRDGTGQARAGDGRPSRRGGRGRGRGRSGNQRSGGEG